MSNALVACFDLDSTTFNVEHREHLSAVGPNRADVDAWIPYSKACIDDTPIDGVVAVIRLLNAAGIAIHFVSGRNVEALEETIEVLAKYDIPWNAIRLHKPDDLRHNGEFKSEYINFLKGIGFTVVVMFEDHLEVCAMITERTGVPCVPVKPPYKDNVGVSFNLSQYPDLVAK